MQTFTASSLLNSLGFIAGTVLYATLLGMVITAAREERRLNRLALIAAGLGFAWNVATLAAHGLQDEGRQLFPLLVAASYCALSLLPSIAIHSVLRVPAQRLPRSSKVVVGLAYFMSFAAAVLHVASVIRFGVAPSQAALRGLAAGYVLLMPPLLLLTRRRDDWGRTLCIASLALFAVSALHMSSHRSTDPWWLELIGHHASLPLVLAILYPDFRFALADIFLKKAVALIGLVSLIFAACFLAASQTKGLDDSSSEFFVLILSIGTALIYPWLQRCAAWFVNKVVLRRMDYEQLLSGAILRLGNQETVEGILGEAGCILEPVLMTHSLGWRETIAVEPRTVVPGAHVDVFVPVAEAPYYILSVEGWTAGRRLLSDELAMLEQFAVLMARRIDAVRTGHERCVRDLREEEMRKLTAEAELRALRAQIHPHFLFNTLTTIGYLIQTSPDRALSTLMRLCSLLRMVLRSTDEFVSLGEELDLIELYLDIERARMEDRLRVRIQVPWELRDIRVPALFLQPLVENAIKHGIGRKSSGGEIHIEARLDHNETVVISVDDTGVGVADAELQLGRAHGIGLTNVEQRLACLQDPAASLRFTSAPGVGTVVEVRLSAEWIHRRAAFLSTPHQNAASPPAR